MNKLDLISWITKELDGCSDTLSLDARFFMEETDDPITLLSFIERRKRGEPVAKIIRHRGFWKREFKTTSATLDPRPDSETLIDAVLKHFPDRQAKFNVLDLGTGTGCLLLSILDEYPNAIGIGVDASDEALAVAEENGMDCPRASFILKNWNEKGWAKGLKKFDLIISNPPYIPSDDILELDETVQNYDPLTALDGGVDGLDPYRIFANSLPALCNNKTLVFFEIGINQEADVIDIMSDNFKHLGFYKDLGNIVRALVFGQK